MYSAAPATQQVKVQAPPNSKPGDTLEIAAYGKRIQVRIPQGVAPGGFFIVLVPTTPAQPAPAADVPMAIPLDAGDMNRGTVQPQPYPASSFVGQQQLVGGPGPLVGGPDYVPPISVDIGDGSLVSILKNCQAIRIEQQPHLIEVCNWEARNEYRMYACDPNNFRLKSAQLLHITETSDCCERQCCGQFRSCELQIRRGTMKESPIIARLVKDFHLNLCFFFMRPRAVIIDHNSVLLGSVYDPCACLEVNQQTYDPNGNKAYRISGTICQMAVCLPCADFTFEIFDSSGRVCGKLIKVFNGCEELILNVNHFVIVFPPDATPEQKAAIFCSAYLIDFQYFEVKKNNNNNSYN